jgi:AraC-like DNA-binding protein
MSLLGKLIESIQVQIINASFYEVVNPFLFDGRIEDKNVLILLNKGHMHAEPADFPIKPETFYFIPRGQHAHLELGKPQRKFIIPESEFINEQNKNKYLKNINGLSSILDKEEVITVIEFEILLFNTMQFFPLLGMPPITIPHDDEFLYLVTHLAIEKQQQKLGKEIIIASYIQEILIRLFRYIESSPKLAIHLEKLNYLTDKRLVSIINYIQHNLEKDLSNKAVAEIALVSEDYVGQFFKTRTKRNLQDYIENQRLEKAMVLLKNLPESILEIASQVGFQDPAYFSRRFKNKYGISATDVKRQKVEAN